MVKPTKGMQPESIDLSKAGRASGSAFQDDSHHNYMGTKIARQREQFGLVLPPDPRLRTQKSSFEKKSNSSVRFAEDVITKHNASTAAAAADSFKKKSKKSKKKRIKKGNKMSSLLRRLQRRHGKVVSNTSTEASIVIKKLADDNNNNNEEKEMSFTDSEKKKPLPTPETTFLSPPSSLRSPHKKKKRSDLFFFGVVIMVNGCTDPDDATLQRLLHKHGGDLEKYETTRVTHIIAECLSMAKANKYKSQRNPKPVCKPAWIVDSVKAERLLPYGNYILDQVQAWDNLGTSKKNMKSFFTTTDTKPSRNLNTLDTETASLGEDASYGSRMYPKKGFVRDGSGDSLMKKPKYIRQTNSKNITFSNKTDGRMEDMIEKHIQGFKETVQTDDDIAGCKEQTFHGTRNAERNDNMLSSTGCTVILCDQQEEDISDFPGNSLENRMSKKLMICNSNETESNAATVVLPKGCCYEQLSLQERSEENNPSKINARKYCKREELISSPEERMKKVRKVTKGTGESGSQCTITETYIDPFLAIDKKMATTSKKSTMEPFRDDCTQRESSISEYDGNGIPGLTLELYPNAKQRTFRRTIESTTKSIEKQVFIEHHCDDFPQEEELIRKNMSVNHYAKEKKSPSEIILDITDSKTIHHSKNEKNNHSGRNTLSSSPSSRMDTGAGKDNIAVLHEKRSTTAVTLRTDEKYIGGKIRTVGTDPNFLESYFKNSRLSFIGSFKQRSEQSSVGKMVPHSSNGGNYDDSQRFVFHVDMDCFFVAVVLRNFPQYRGKPVAISHHGKKQEKNRREPTIVDSTIQNNRPSFSASTKNSTSECATCNYEARKFGVKKGMFLGRAREFCPELIVLDYDFKGYEEVAEQVASILYGYRDSYNGKIEQVSCDESYMELFVPFSKGDSNGRASIVADSIRENIFTTTQCTASIGVGPNKFLAKLATDRAKPNGTFVVRDHHELLQNLKLRDLHGIGHRTDRKLAVEAGLSTVRDVWNLGDYEAEKRFARVLGPGLGKKIVGFCRGEDDRPVKPAERKTIGAECNYGVRFDGPYGIDHMITNLAKEVEKRMNGVGVLGSRVTFKLKQRKDGAGRPGKFLGHGSCLSLSKSAECQSTRDWKVFSQIGMTLCNELGVPPDNIRGAGIVVSKLVKDDCAEATTARGHGNASMAITKWFCNSMDTRLKDAKDQREDTIPDERATLRDTGKRSFPLPFEDNSANKKLCDAGKHVSSTGIYHDEITGTNKAELQHPSFSQVDKGVWSNLPQEIREQIIAESSPQANALFKKAGLKKHPENIDRSIKVIELDENISSYDNQKNMEKENTIEVINNDSSEENQKQIILDDEKKSSQNIETTIEIDDSESNSEEGTDGNHELEDDLMLPPLSQIHMSQVAALPNSLQKRVYAEISKKISSSNGPQEKEEEKKVEHVIGEDSNLFNCHQVSLKRIMRLAAVKAGKETIPASKDERVSLTQLECLPLDLQLQIANHDEITANAKKSSHKGKFTKTKYDPPTNVKLSHSKPMNKSDLPTGTTLEEPDTQQREQIQEENNDGDEYLDTQQGSFYIDNVVPLQQFMDENSLAEDDAIDHMIGFFQLCLAERRFHDTVVLLRTVRNRRDCWSKQGYMHILRAVEDRYKQIFKCSLDTEWLGL